MRISAVLRLLHLDLANPLIKLSKTVLETTVFLLRIKRAICCLNLRLDRVGELILPLSNATFLLVQHHDLLPNLFISHP